MASPKILKTSSSRYLAKRGFTLIELLVVIGMLSILGGVSLILSMDSYRGYNFHTERDLLLVALYRARAEAVNNMCFVAPGLPCTDGEAHGVHIAPDAFIVFQGATYSATDPRNEVITRQAASVQVSGNDVVFAQLSASLAASTTITLAEGPHTSTVTVGTEGQIFWSN